MTRFRSVCIDCDRTRVCNSAGLCDDCAAAEVKAAVLEHDPIHSVEENNGLRCGCEDAPCCGH